MPAAALKVHVACIQQYASAHARAAAQVTEVAEAAEFQCSESLSEFRHAKIAYYAAIALQANYVADIGLPERRATADIKKVTDYDHGLVTKTVLDGRPSAP
jgi:hypothetical protein